MRLFVISLIIQILFSCGTTYQSNNGSSSDGLCEHLALVKVDSSANDKSKEILKMVKDSIFQITSKKEGFSDTNIARLYFNKIILEPWDGNFNGNFIQWDNLIFLNNLNYFILNKQNKVAFQLLKVRQDSETKSLYCYKKWVIYHIYEFYESHYLRDLYFILDKDLRVIKSFAVPSLEETTGSDIQEFKFESKNSIIEAKDGKLAIRMDMQIIRSETTKETFKVDIPFNEATGTFMDLNKILPLLSPDIPISDTENIVIQNLSKPSK